MEEQDFSGFSNAEVVREYTQKRGDRAAGREIMRRVIERAGLPLDEYQAKQLRGRDGRPLVTDGGQPITVQDYLNEVVVRHPDPIRAEAIRGVLGFIVTDVSHPDFASKQQAIVTTVEAHT